MEKIKLLTGSVIVLFLLNIAIICYLFFGVHSGFRPGNHDRAEPKDIIAAKLHFDANQKKAYEGLIKDHRHKINNYDTKIRSAKSNLYMLLSKPDANLELKDSLTTLLSKYQKQIEKTNFEHFLDIKKLCNPDQINDFDELTAELGNMFVHDRPRPSPQD